MAFIYKVTNTVNGKIYIGKSKRNDPAYLGSGLKITAAINKYSKTYFKKEIIEECDESIVSTREIYWIKVYQSTDTIIGYNISKGGEGGSHYWATLTNSQKIAHNKKISDSKLGKKLKPHSAETRIKQSISFKQHANDNPNFFKERALKKCKSYVCVDYSTSSFYRTNNLKEFCNEHSIDLVGMRHAARTRKNLYKEKWACSIDLYKDTEPAIIMQQIRDEIAANNAAYKEKIRQHMIQRKKYGNV